MPETPPWAPAAPVSPRPESPRPCRLSDVRDGLNGVRGDPGETWVTGITHDSRAVRPGDLYVALPGARAHGVDFAEEAVRSGAVALFTDEAGRDRAASTGVPVLTADDARAVLGTAARIVYGSPAAEMLVLGVTGTDGKTTTAYLLEAGLRAAGHITGLIGTVQTRIGTDVLPSVRTTPEATDLQALLALMRERAVTAVAMEVSSHALALARIDGVDVDVAAFTNLSQDHLDFHPTMADYEAAKARLFTPHLSRRGVTNVDDAAGRRLATAARIPMTTYGAGGDWRAEDVELRAAGSTFRLVGPGVEAVASVQLPGSFNVANAVCALVSLIVAGVPVADAVQGVAHCPGVPGRMERIDEGQPFLAVVDYAHTPKAVATLLAAVRALTPGRVIVVLGCGGDRDRTKRGPMGAAAAAGSDLALLTSDNPRSEDPLAILAEMAAGAPQARVEPDRRTAIEIAVHEARPGDTVVVAGKGHETGQETAGRIAPFDDREVLREALRSVAA
ncbi:MAG TPA: UDP-N-acetylmuramoyl-L-alanyl-D-glutamate--2,6-diaminopimelate ligase [Mycobacteriales bacterium]|nr:UDP-N-acetylmuramoyl-L-alanyl-D-glutamate--2,6-diaminopimelate ligase [Mycobacteriales bacterium]